MKFMWNLTILPSSNSIYRETIQMRQKLQFETDFFYKEKYTLFPFSVLTPGNVAKVSQQYFYNRCSEHVKCVLNTHAILTV